MYINKSTKIMIASCAFLFLMAGVFHYMDLHVENLPVRLSSVSYMAYLTICMLCVVYSRRNMPQPVSRRYILVGVGFLFAWELITMMEQMLFPADHIANRVLWYLYYIPTVFVPNILLMAILNFDLHPKQKINPKWYITFAISGVLDILIFTNDYHRKAFSFPEGIENFYVSYEYEIIYYIIMGWMFVLFMLCISALYLRARKEKNRKLLWTPYLGLTVALIYFIWYATGRKVIPWFNDFYGVPEFFQGILIVTMGLCVCLGLIRANFNFIEFFQASNISATLVDSQGVVRYHTQDIIPITEEQRQRAIIEDIYIDENKRLHSQKITAGHIFWINDLSSITEIRSKLSEVKSSLEQDNNLIQAENQIISRKTKVDEKNRLYTMLAQNVESELDTIEDIIDNAVPGEVGFRRKLAKACIYKAYVKRYCNLVLLSQDSPVLNSFELENSIRESLDYISLNDITCWLDVKGEGEYLAEDLIEGYKAFQSAVEDNVDDLERVLVLINVYRSLNMTIDLSLKSGGDKRIEWAASPAPKPQEEPAGGAEADSAPGSGIPDPPAPEGGTPS